MKKTPRVLTKLGESEKVETMGRTARRRQGVFFGRLGVPERSGAGAAGSGRCAVGVFFEEGGGSEVGRPAVRGRCGAGAGTESRGGCVFQWASARRTAGAVRVAEGSGGEVNAVGTAVRALVEAPVGFEKTLEGIGRRDGGVEACGGAGVEHVGCGAGGDGRRESGGGEHRAERGMRGWKNGGAGRRHRHAGSPRAGAGCVFRQGAGRGRAQRSSSTSTTGRVWRLKVLPLPSLMGITVAR